MACEKERWRIPAELKTTSRSRKGHITSPGRTNHITTMPLTQYIYDVDMIWSDVDSQLTPHHATSRICVSGGVRPLFIFSREDSAARIGWLGRHGSNISAGPP